VHWLPLAFAMEFGFGQVFKWSERRGHYAPVVVTTNYLTLCGLLAAYYLVQDNLAIDGRTALVGLVTGTVFICSMLTMTYTLTLVKASAVLTAFRLALVVPTAASALIWAEPFAATQVAGALLAIVALVLMTRNAGALLHLGNARCLGLVLLVFALQGTSLTCLRWMQYAGLGGDQPKILIITGLVAGLWGTLFLLLNRRRPQRDELAAGAGIGVYNMVALIVILTALGQVPGTVFFPLMGCTVVVLDNLAARFLWQEQLSSTTLAGIALALLAILIVL
jgi:drug/metabolite transporter (DMT)-like permease